MSMDEIDFEGIDIQELWEEQRFVEQVMHAERACSGLLDEFVKSGIPEETMRNQSMFAMVLLSSVCKTMSLALMEIANSDKNDDATIGYQNGMLSCLVLLTSLRKKIKEL